jgi:hypothetical protein
MCAAQESGWANEHAADEAAADVDSASLVAAGAGELA